MERIFLCVQIKAIQIDSSICSFVRETLKLAYKHSDKYNGQRPFLSQSIPDTSNGSNFLILFNDGPINDGLIIERDLTLLWWLRWSREARWKICLPKVYLTKLVYLRVVGEKKSCLAIEEFLKKIFFCLEKYFSYHADKTRFVSLIRIRSESRKSYQEFLTVNF